MDYRRKRGRENLHITTGDLCELFGVTLRTIGRWEREGKLDRKDLRSICDLYKRRVKKEE